MTHKEKALVYFGDKFHCSQSVLAAFADEVGEYSKEALRRGDDKPVVVKDYPLVTIEEAVASPQLYTEKLIAVQGPIRYFVTGNEYEMQAENGTGISFSEILFIIGIT